MGASKPQVPGIKAAKRTGLYTVATDISETAEGAKHADLHVKISATDVDKLLNLAHEINEKYQLVGCYGIADYAYEAIGVINEEFGLPGCNREVYARAANKDISKKMWQKNGLPTADALSITENDSIHKFSEIIKRQLSLPVVVKPVNSFNSRGITVLESLNELELEAAVNRGLRQSNKVMVEEFIKGKHVNIDVLMLEGKGLSVSCTERSFYGTPGNLSSWGLQPAGISEATRAELYDLAVEAATCLGLITGPITADIILSEGKPKLLELSPHYHSLFTNTIRDGGASIEAWFRYLSDMPINKNEFLNHSNAGAYIYLIGSKRQVEEIMNVISGQVKIVDTDIRNFSEGRCLKIVWLKGRNCKSLKSLLKNLQNMVEGGSMSTNSKIKGFSYKN